MARRRPTTGEIGWVGLVGYVVLVDAIAWKNQKKDKKDETMSVAFGRSLQHPVARIGTLCAWSLVTAHLFWCVPLPGGKTLKRLVQGR